MSVSSQVVVLCCSVNVADGSRILSLPSSRIGSSGTKYINPNTVELANMACRMPQPGLKLNA